MFESVADHINRVRELARAFASAFQAESSVEAAAYLHDLGKYSKQFQMRLRDRREAGRDHWTLGARKLLASHDPRTVMPAAAILGHHIGLDRLMHVELFAKELSQRLCKNADAFTTTSKEEHQLALDAFRLDGFECPTMSGDFVCRHDGAADMLDTRMIFSALVDADFLATEGHFEGDATIPYRPRQVGRQFPIGEMLKSLERYVHSIAHPAAESAIFKVRQNLMKDCKNSGAESAQGLFTLTAPTGAGKTLAMLRFALEHACRHNLRRIVLVMPFLNIIDQTASIYRNVFPPNEYGDDLILEAHSLAGHESTGTGDDGTTVKELRRRLISQNWDAPIVLTTNVAILESLHSRSPAACRKLHRLARSVLLFDEVQTLPPKLAVTTLATLHRLAHPQGPYRSSIVFATATQPAFESLSDRLRDLTDKSLLKVSPSWKPTEITSDAETMFQIAAKRVQVRWREKQAIPLIELATELNQYEQVLCIVNLKRHAITLTAELYRSRQDVLHLSTNMCAEHRTAVLKIVRERLDKDKPICLVATQCVEAGVDIDFPVLYRALAPIEAIAQAAGRCNRAGNRDTCLMTVFTPAEDTASVRLARPYPPGYHIAIETTKTFLESLRARGEDIPDIINSPSMLRDYFRLLYSLSGRDNQEQTDEKELHTAVIATSFAEVAKHYRLIEKNVLNVIVPYRQQAYDQLLKDGNEAGRLTPNQIRKWQRLARRHSVAIFRPSDTNNDLFPRMLPIHFGVEGSHSGGPSTGDFDWWYPAHSGGYDDLVGLQLAEPQWVM